MTCRSGKGFDVVLYLLYQNDVFATLRNFFLDSELDTEDIRKAHSRLILAFRTGVKFG
jgi:hypothetical protein